MIKRESTGGESAKGKPTTKCTATSQEKLKAMSATIPNRNGPKAST